MNSIFKKVFVSIVLALPLISSAAMLGETSKLFRAALDIINDLLIPLAFSLALLFFFWGVAKYIYSEGTGKEEGKKIMIWGVVALFVMSSIWGLVSFIRGELIGNNNPTNSNIPTIGGSSSGPGYNVDGRTYIPGM